MIDQTDLFPRLNQQRTYCGSSVVLDSPGGGWAVFAGAGHLQHSPAPVLGVVRARHAHQLAGRQVTERELEVGKPRGVGRGVEQHQLPVQLENRDN